MVSMANVKPFVNLHGDAENQAEMAVAIDDTLLHGAGSSADDY